MNGGRRISSIRLLLFCEAVLFLMAAFVHAGMWIDGYQHRAARITESVLAGALYVGLGFSWLRPLQTRNAGIVAEGFALFGTLIGIFTIIVGVGPQTILDILYHLGMVGLLSWGLLYTIRTPTDLSEKSERHGLGARHNKMLMAFGVSSGLQVNGKRDKSHKLFPSNGGPNEKQSRMV